MRLVQPHKQAKAIGNREVPAKFCPECGKEVEPTTYGSVCEDHKDKSLEIHERTLKYNCRVCGNFAANRDTFCRYCGLEH